MACGKQWEGELPGHGSEPWMLRHVNTCLSMEVNPVWNGLWSAGALRAADLLPAALPGQLLHSQRSPWVLFSLSVPQSCKKDEKQELKAQEELVKPEELCKTRVGVCRVHKTE